MEQCRGGSKSRTLQHLKWGAHFKETRAWSNMVDEI